MGTTHLDNLLDLELRLAVVRAHAAKLDGHAKRLGRSFTALSDLTPIDAPPGGDGQRNPPTAFLVWGFGPIATTKGDFLFDNESATSVMAAWKDYGNRLTFDYEHKAVDPDRRPGDGKAAGSFLLELRDDGLWTTDVRWTAKASAELAAGEWLYFSPYFVSDEKTGRILELINIALTNVPATKGMTPLVSASRGAPMTTQKTISTQEREIASRLGVSLDDWRATRAVNDDKFRRVTASRPVSPTPGSAPAPTTLTAAEREICANMGIAPDAFAEQRRTGASGRESCSDE